MRAPAQRPGLGQPGEAVRRGVPGPQGNDRPDLGFFLKRWLRIQFFLYYRIIYFFKDKDPYLYLKSRIRIRIFHV